MRSKCLALRPESASDERIGVGGQALFPQPRHEIGDVQRLCPGYSIKHCWRRSPKHRDKAATLFHGLADRRVVVAEIVPAPCRCHRSATLPVDVSIAPSQASERSRLGQTPALRCTALAIGPVLRSLSMDAQAETWIEVSRGTARLINAGAVASPTCAESANLTYGGSAGSGQGGLIR